jgi:hypothetical protein
VPSKMADQFVSCPDTMVGECGDDWTAVAALVPDRTDVECGNRWARAFGSINEDKEVCDTDNGDKQDQGVW